MAGYGACCTSATRRISTTGGRAHEDLAEGPHPVAGLLAGADAALAELIELVETGQLELELQGGGIVLGLGANTAIADATSVHLCYEGNISGQDSSHALTAGLRMTW